MILARMSTLSGVCEEVCEESGGCAMEGVRLKSALLSWKITVPSTAIFFDMALGLAATPAKATSYKTNAAMHQ